MKTYIIAKQESGKGSIHSIASGYYDREIKFPSGHLYAVVLSAYYGGKGYTTHKTKEAAIKRYISEKASCTIIDDNGVTYYTDGFNLYPRW